MYKAPGLLFLLALLSTAANAECIRPSKPANLPDGNTATREEMVAANSLVKTYSADMNACTQCIQDERNAALAKVRDDSGITREAAQARTAQHRNAILSTCKQACQDVGTTWMQKHNIAIDEMQDVVVRFNEQLRIFKSTNPK